MNIEEQPQDIIESKVKPKKSKPTITVVLGSLGGAVYGGVAGGLAGGLVSDISGGKFRVGFTLGAIVGSAAGGITGGVGARNGYNAELADLFAKGEVPFDMGQLWDSKKIAGRYNKWGCAISIGGGMLGVEALGFLALTNPIFAAVGIVTYTWVFVAPMMMRDCASV